MRHPDYHRFQKFKVLSYPHHLAAIARGDLCAPVEWVIYPANVCGYHCPHCIMAEEQQLHRKMLTPKAMEKIPEDAYQHGIRTVIFSGGGDPLANKHTPEIAFRLKLLKIQVYLNNQGYLLSDPTPYDGIRYSVDAATEETYKKIHRFDGWKRVVENIERHADLRRAGENIEMGLAFLITPWNSEETSQFCDWAQQFEPDFVHIRPAFLDSAYLDKEYPGGGEALKNEIIPSLAELGKRMEKQYANVYFRVDKFEGYWTPKRYDKCRATPLIAVTSGDGAFLVCQDRGIKDGEEYLRWGDYNRQTFQEIWFGDDHRRVLESIDLANCPRCVENGYNEIIEAAYFRDELKLALL